MTAADEIHSEGTTAQRDRATSKICSAVRVRIRVNVAIALKGDWKALKKWYEPKKVKDLKDPNDTELLNLLAQQEAVKDKIETAKKPSTDPIKSLLIIKALRSEFPKLAASIPPPPEPQQPPPSSAANIKYPSSFSSTLLPTTPPGAYTPQFPRIHDFGKAPNISAEMPTTQRTGLQTASSQRKRGLGDTTLSPLKKIKTEDAVQINDSEDDESDGEFNPKQNTAAGRGERARKRIRADDFTTKLKNAVTEEQLLRQHVELKQKFRLDEIQIFKKIAHIHGDGAKEFKLVEEELEIKHQREREKARRKYEAMVPAVEKEVGLVWYLWDEGTAEATRIRTGTRRC